MEVMDAVVPEKSTGDMHDDGLNEDDPSVQVIYDEPTVEVTYDDPVIEETEDDIIMTTTRRKTTRTKYRIQEVSFLKLFFLKLRIGQRKFS